MTDLDGWTAVVSTKETVEYCRFCDAEVPRTLTNGYGMMTGVFHCRHGDGTHDTEG